MKSKRNNEHSVIDSTVDGPRERKAGLEKVLGDGGWRPSKSPGIAGLQHLMQRV